MTAVLGHTIVPVRDQDESVDFYTNVLGFQYGGRAGMNDVFAMICLNDSSALDLRDSDEIPGLIHHYAFVLDRAHFDRYFQAIKDSGIPFGNESREAANMFVPGASTSHKCETLSVYFNGHSGHLLEIITYEWKPVEMPLHLTNRTDSRSLKIDVGGSTIENP